MQNIQILLNCDGLNTYVCKYVGSIDEGNCVVINTDKEKGDTLTTQTIFYITQKFRVQNIVKQKRLKVEETSNIKEVDYVAYLKCYRIYIRIQKYLPI